MFFKKPITKFILGIFFIVMSLFLLFGVSVYRQFRIIKNKINENTVGNISTFDFSRPNKEILSRLNTDDDPFTGTKDAKLIIIEFADFKCSYCGKSYVTVRRLTSEYKDSILFIYKDFPSVSEESFDFALAGECADDQGKFWQFHDKVYANQSVTAEQISELAISIGMNMNEFNNCMRDRKFDLEVQNDIIEGENAGVTGTPTFFINGIKVPGDIPYDVFKKIIDTTLDKL